MNPYVMAGSHKQPSLRLRRPFFGLVTGLLCVLSLIPLVATAQTTMQLNQSVRLQYQPSQNFQLESEQQLKRAVVVARKYKSNAGTLFTAYLLLTNIAAADNCDIKKAALTTDSDFALVAIISEKFKEKEGPEGTAIHRILFGSPDQSSRHLFVATPAQSERLQSIVGDVSYNAHAAWHIGWGSGTKVTVVPKGSEQAVPLEISHEQGNGWSLLLNHLSAKKEWLGINPSSTTYLVFSRGENGPAVRFNHRDKKISVSGNVPLTVCGKIPEDVPTPFVPVR